MFALCCHLLCPQQGGQCSQPSGRPGSGCWAIVARTDQPEWFQHAGTAVDLRVSGSHADSEGIFLSQAGLRTRPGEDRALALASCCCRRENCSPEVTAGWWPCWGQEDGAEVFWAAWPGQSTSPKVRGAASSLRWAAGICRQAMEVVPLVSETEGESRGALPLRSSLSGR